MRESNFTFPPQNRAVVSITHLLYDRRALDTSSHLSILNNLTSLTYLTSTSPRIREILTTDGGLERLLDILRESLFPRDGPTPHDLWGLSGPPTARVISVDRAILCRHSLAFQCVVNIGVRGSESIRTRVVQAGALDLVAQILESWLKRHGVGIFASPLGSQMAVDMLARGMPISYADHYRSRPEIRGTQSAGANVGGTYGTGTIIGVGNPAATAATSAVTVLAPSPAAAPSPQAPAQPVNTGRSGRGSFGQFMASLTRRRADPPPQQHEAVPADEERSVDTDVDMADEEGGGDTDRDSTSGGADDSMEIDGGGAEMSTEPSGQTATPRASQVILPLTMTIPNRTVDESMSASVGSSAGNSFSSAGLGPGPIVAGIPRTASDNSLAVSGGSRLPPGPLNLNARIPSLAQDPTSTQSSPMGSPSRVDPPRPGRRDTIVARPVNLNLALPPRTDRQDRGDGTQSEASDVDVDLQTATIRATLRAVHAQAQGQNVNGLAETQDGQDADLVVAEQDEEDGLQQRGQIGVDDLAEEQARLDLEAGAPPGQPGATQTPRVPTEGEPTPRAALLAQPGGQNPADPAQPAQIIIANGAPRGFNDLGSYVGISSLLNPEGDQYSEDSILLSLQLLAYLSKYPHVRAAFHHPRRPMHQTFDLGTDTELFPLPERPAVSETPNVFSLVERFTFRPSPSDPMMHRIPAEIQYWAGVIMRNACRKDEAQGGIRQCANMRCGKWEKEQREFAKCRRCRKAKYCSKECQSKAWAEGHKFWCNVKNEGEPGAPGPHGGFPPGAGAPDADDDDEYGEDGGPGGGRRIARPQARQQEQFVPPGRHIRLHGHGHALTIVTQNIAVAPPRPPQPAIHQRRAAHRADSIRSDVAVINDDAVNHLLPENTQLDLLRQTQRRNRTTTDEMADMPDRRGRAGAPALGLGALFNSHGGHQGATAPSSPQTLLPTLAPPPTPASTNGRSPQPSHTPTTTPPLHLYQTHSTASPGPGEAFSPLAMPRQNRSPAWSTRAQRGGRTTDMIPTAERTVSPLQPTFQIPVFGQGASRGGQR